jgi:predicted secreted protein
MSWPALPAPPCDPPEEEQHRPLYARVLCLRHLDPGGVLCFLFFEGTFALGLLLALAELVNWWTVPLLPFVVAAMVKANDVVAGAVVRAAAGVPHTERERFRRQMLPAVGRATVPVHRCAQRSVAPAASRAYAEPAAHVDGESAGAVSGRDAALVRVGPGPPPPGATEPMPQASAPGDGRTGFWPGWLIHPGRLDWRRLCRAPGRRAGGVTWREIARSVARRGRGGGEKPGTA